MNRKQKKTKKNQTSKKTSSTKEHVMNKYNTHPHEKRRKTKKKLDVFQYVIVRHLSRKKKKKKEKKSISIPYHIQLIL